jgi:hypothetical protein
LGLNESETSTFSIETDTDAGTSGGDDGGSSGGSSKKDTTKEVTFENISNVITNPGESKRVNVFVENSGTIFLNDCEVRLSGQGGEWLSSEEIKDLAVGEEHNFILDLNVPDDTESELYNVLVSLDCKDFTKSTSFDIEIMSKELDFSIISAERVKEGIRVTYSLEERSGIDQDVELQFLLIDENNQNVVEVGDVKYVSANSKEELEIIIPYDSSLKDKELSMLINLNSETYSTFIQEDLLIGEASKISGLSIVGSDVFDNVASIFLIMMFVIFAAFMIARILKHAKKIKKRSS